MIVSTSRIVLTGVVYFDEPEVPISRPADGSDEEEVSRD